MYIVIRTIGAIQNSIKRGGYQDSDYDTSLSDEDDENEAPHEANLVHS